MGKERVSYTTAEKLKIINYAETNGNEAAGREFKVNEANTRQWRLKKDQVQQLPKKKMAERGRETIHPQMEEQLNAWIQDVQQQGVGISMAEVKIKAKIIAKQIKIANSKASQGCYRFFRRHKLSMRRRTHITQRLSEDYEEKVTDFQRNDYALDQIGHADQTPLTFDIPYTTTVATKGDRSISIKTTGNEKNRFTVMLACTANGGKLPPYVTFTRKTLPKEKIS